MNEDKKFAAWMDQVGLDHNDCLDDIVVLYDDIARERSDVNADYGVSKDGDILHIVPLNSDLPTFDMPATSKATVIRFIDALYPEHGGVHGEESFRHNMERNN